MAEEKRKRCPNWLLSEKSLLLELVEKHLSVIENKKTDAATMKKKLAEWRILANEYNSQTSYFSRIAETLKKQWDFMKKNAKKEESHNRRNTIPTGGVPGYIKKDDPLHTKIITLIKTSAAGPSNPLDSDSVLESSDNNNISVTPVTLSAETLSKGFNIDTGVTQHTTAAIDSKVIVLQDWSDYKPKLLRTTFSKPPQLTMCEKEGIKKESCTSRRRFTYRTTGSSLQRLYEKKIEAIDYQKMVAEKKMELDLQIKREQLKQEKLKTRILLLDLRLKKKKLNER